MNTEMDGPRLLGLAVLAGIDADGLASIRASLKSLADHPGDGAPALDFLAELDQQLAEIHAVLCDPGGPQLIGLAATIAARTSCNLPTAITMAAFVLRPPQP